MRLKLGIILLGIVAVTAAALRLEIVDEPRPTETGNLIASSVGYTSAEELVYDSRAIFIGEFLGETEERFELRSPVVEHTGDFRVDVFRTFRVTEAVKGPISRGDQVVVWYTRRLEIGNGPAIDSELPGARKGDTYALFLTRVQHEEGKAIWGQIGDPGVAEVQGQALKFESAGHYRASLQGQGLQLQPGSGAPFHLTLPRLRELAQKNEPAPAPSPPASSGTPLATKEVPADAR